MATAHFYSYLAYISGHTALTFDPKVALVVIYNELNVIVIIFGYFLPENTIIKAIGGAHCIANIVGLFFFCQ